MKCLSMYTYPYRFACTVFDVDSISTVAFSYMNVKTILMSIIVVIGLLLLLF